MNAMSSIQPPGRLLKLKDVVRETSLSSRTIYRRMDADEFPKPRPIGGGRVAWLERDVEAWKASILSAPPK